MALDDTPNRVYIQDLAAEIAALDQDDDDTSHPAVVFLPDIDRALAALPTTVLRAGGGPRSLHGVGGMHLEGAGKELVLYRPLLWTSGEGEEGRRIQARAVPTQSSSDEGQEGGGVETAHGYGAGEYDMLADVDGQRHDAAAELADEDGDAMDIG